MKDDVAALSRGRDCFRVGQVALNCLNAKIAQLVKKGDKTSALYTSLVDKQQLLSTLESLQTQNAVLVRQALNAPKIKPTPVRNGVLGLMLGLALCLLIAPLAVYVVFDSDDALFREATTVPESMFIAPTFALRMEPLPPTIRRAS